MDLSNGDTSTTGIPNVLSELPKIEFSWYDYSLFALMLLGSVFIGLYFGCVKKQTTAEDYLMGGKKMKAVPVAFSMIASAISGVSLLSVPAEVYQFGTHYWWSGVVIVLIAVIIYKVYLPVFITLQLTSTYEYLNLRFNGTVRLVSSVLFIMNIFLFLPVTIYLPALAFTQATSINLHFVTPLICGICIFYTTIGGLKAVVWSDALQFTAMLGAMGAIFYLGLINSEGVLNVWTKSKAGGRLDVDMDISPLKRDTFWASVIGISSSWIAHIGVGQGSIQKFLSLPSMNECKKCITILAFGMFLNKTYIVLIGLMMYTKYYDCDPITSGQIEKADQMISFFVMDVARHIPGLPGLFIAGVFCASLSTLSAILNCVSGVIYEDFLKRFMPKDISEESIGNILKLIVLITGIISTALVFVIENLGNIFPLGMKLTGLSQGPLVGLFTLGMVFPVANAKGAMAGGLASLTCLIWMLVGNYYYQSKGILREVPKPLKADGCSFPVNVTTIPASITDDELPFFLYRISYYYYIFFGAIVTIIVGLIVSYLTRKEDDPPVHKDLISPVMHFLLPKQEAVITDKIYYPVGKALDVLRIETGDEKFANIKQ